MENNIHKYLEIESDHSRNSKFSGNQHLLYAIRKKCIAIYSSQNIIDFMLYISFGKPKLNVANSLGF